MHDLKVLLHSDVALEHFQEKTYNICLKRLLIFNLIFTNGIQLIAEVWANLFCDNSQASSLIVLISVSFAAHILDLAGKAFIIYLFAEVLIYFTQKIKEARIAKYEEDHDETFP